MLILHSWLKDYLGDNTPSVSEIDDLLTFHAFEIDGIEKVGEQDVIDVKVLPDRSGDALSHRGIAHEIAVLTGKPLAYDPFREARTLEPKTEKITVSIEDPALCRRFGMALMIGVTITESPEWLKERLKALGQRSINNVVDATNFVMLALGQPLHAYDGDIFPHPPAGGDGVWHFGVRRARAGEKITTLTNDEYELDTNVQLIVDSSNDAPAGIAGIKGGKYAEVTNATTTILLEAANFEPVFTRRASQFLKLQTDASKRFENEISRDVVPYALTEVVKLILDIAGGTCEGYVDVYPTPVINPEVTLTLAQTNALLGLSLIESEVEAILKRLAFAVTPCDGGWTVVAPFERRDIQIPEDVIAEVGRVYGLTHITSVVPPTVPLTEISARQVYSEKIRETLTKLGFSEVITSSFRNKDEITLANALASDKGALRSSLRQNLNEALDKNMPNIDLLGITTLKIFEIGTVFTKGGEAGVREHFSVALGARVKQQGYSPKDDTLLTETLTKLSEILGVPVHAEIKEGVAEFDLGALLAILPAATSYVPFKSTDVSFVPFSQYPFVSRDIALWVPEGVVGPETTQALEVETLIRDTAGSLCIRITQFDEFKKDGRISYAFRLVFQSYEKTLTDEEIAPIMASIVERVAKKGWEVR